jgi:hypothetical protein
VLATAWLVVGAGAVVVVGSRVVEGAVGTGPTDFGLPLAHALSASRPATAMAEALQVFFRRIVVPPSCLVGVDGSILLSGRNRRNSIR